MKVFFWLEEFLSEAPFATLTVTHDRLFLNRISKKIWELDYRNQNGLLVVEGDYVDYCEVKENLMHAQERQEETMKNVLRRETAWLRKGPKARTTKQQARIDRAGELAEDVADLSELNRKREVKLDFVGADKNPKKLIEAKNISKSYGPKQVIKDFSLFLSPGSRVGILGINGAGKSTLLRLLLVLEKPDQGEVHLADALQVSYFEQNRESLDPNLTVLQSVCPQGDHVKFNGNFVHVRSYLDRFLFNADKAAMPVSKLSGGEQSRLLIARLMLKEANVLVLDEPTNDLDMVTLNILEDRLRDFPGAVLLVTHDRYFMHRVATQILAIDQHFDPGHVESFSDLEQWEAWQKKQSSTALAAEKVKTAEKTSPGKAEVKKESKAKLGFKEQHELKNMEATIHKAEAELEALLAQSNDPQNLSNSSRMKELYEKTAEVQLEVERLYKRWAELEALA
ncbi:MAG: ATP-binding cassette domain-containing protein [Bdellovibrionota bacterium]